MGFRYYDWECADCGGVFDGLTWVNDGWDPPRVQQKLCPHCGRDAICERRISAPAQYMGERAWCPMVAGGRFDTMGQKPTRRLPMPSEGVTNDPAALKEHFRSREWRDAKAQRAEQNARNALRRERAERIKQGQSFNLRRSEDRLPGDPKP